MMKRLICALLCLLYAVIAPSAALASSTTPSGTPSTAPGSVSPTPGGTPIPTPVATPINLGLAPEDFDRVLKADVDEGDIIVWLQERLVDLGYFNFKVTGFFGSSTKDAVIAFQLAHSLTPDGDVGVDTYTLLYSGNARRGYGPRGTPTPKPTPKPAPKKKYGTEIQWSKAHGLVARRGGGKFKVRDFYTGDEYFFIRVGGTQHMDVETATKRDTATFKNTYGGRWSWDRRPVLVYLKGGPYAGSVNGMPHGYETISGNGMTNQVCLHFTNSRTHGSGVIDPAHQRCIKKAAGK